MKSLWNKTRNQQIAECVEEALTFAERSRGLLGKKSYPAGHVLWIHQCNSIHTWFMQFPIDVIFVDRHLRVKAIYANVKPWRLIWPVWSAKSTFEFAAGQLRQMPIETGDELDVRG